jgi:hypothetical protein
MMVRSFGGKVSGPRRSDRGEDFSLHFATRAFYVASDLGASACATGS